MPGLTEVLVPMSHPVSLSHLSSELSAWLSPPCLPDTVQDRGVPSTRVGTDPTGAAVKLSYQAG